MKKQYVLTEDDIKDLFQEDGYVQNIIADIAVKFTTEGIKQYKEDPEGYDNNEDDALSDRWWGKQFKEHTKIERQIVKEIKEFLLKEEEE